jgi:BolA protein
MRAERRAQHIEHTLRSALRAVHVEVVDDSHRHQGHPGARQGAGHFRVLVVSPEFEGLSRVDAQRLVYAQLQDVMEEDIHALQLKTMTPEVWRDQRGR